MKDKYKELDYIFSKENKYKDEDDIPMQLNEKQQRKIMLDNIIYRTINDRKK